MAMWHTIIVLRSSNAVVETNFFQKKIILLSCLSYSLSTSDKGGTKLRAKPRIVQFYVDGVFCSPDHLCFYREFEMSYNHRMAWVGMDLKDHLVPTPLL